MQFSEYIKHIGRGKKAGKYLTQIDAKCAMDQVLSGSVPPLQVGAFLMLLRMREESEAELAGFLQASRAYNNCDLKSITGIDLDLGCYAGKRRQLPWFILAVLALADSGLKIFVHGTREPDSKRLYLDDVFKTLGLPVSHSTADATLSLNTHNFCYMDLASINPPLKLMIDLRQQFGLRTCANTLARMLNPISAKCSLHGVYHKGFDERHIKVASLTNDVQVGCFRGEGGEIEANPERDFTLHIIDENRVEKTIQFAQSHNSRQLKADFSQLEIIKNVWQGETQSEYADKAIISTLAVMLALVEGADSTLALERGKCIWGARNRSRYFS